ncbi:hypothetical protein JCGZ_10010 [Jatropha curcas]|uniref:Uncharacterized protein n=1 Tax=Jatropha curcas TaxID=180498 RepID=A0A067KW17_JATCU|nr:hypothetical protein JCGZ_10010 [Jatropha curcas]
MVGISWQFLTQNQDFLLGTGMLPGTVWSVPGSGSLEASARAVLFSTARTGFSAWACALTRPEACTPLELWSICSTGVLQLHGRASAARAKSFPPVRTRACSLARAGACAPLEVWSNCGTGVPLSMVWGVCASFLCLSCFAIGTGMLISTPLRANLYYASSLSFFYAKPYNFPQNQVSCVFKEAFK